MDKRLIFLVFLACLHVNGFGQEVSTIAGTGFAGSTGDNGPATLASFSVFSTIASDRHHNLYIADVGNHKIRKINLNTNIVTTVAGIGNVGFGGDNGSALLALFDNPTYVVTDSNGNIFITDANNRRIRKIDITSGVISTIAGNGSLIYNGDGILATTASIGPTGICIDKNGSLLISDNTNHRIRKVDNNGLISTICGTGVDGYSGDGMLATLAEIGGVTGICVDDSNNIYLSCLNQSRVRKISAATGIITTFAGNGNIGFSGDGSLAISAELNWPFSVSTNKLGEVFIADQVNNRIRKVNSSGIISTVAGDGITGFDGDGGPADTATFNRPAGVAFDTCGNMYIADKMNKRVRKVTYDTCGTTSTQATNLQRQEINIYPNPAYSQITITANNKLNDATITNAIGQVVLQQKIDKEKAEINIAHLQSGIYFVAITDADGAKVLKKIVKE